MTKSKFKRIAIIALWIVVIIILIRGVLLLGGLYVMLWNRIELQKYFSYIDGWEIFKYILVFVFINFYVKMIKISFVHLLIQFKESIGMRLKYKFVFFICAFIYMSIGILFIFMFLLALVLWYSKEFLLTNINFFIALYSATSLYYLWNLFLYTSAGILPFINNISAKAIEDEVNKLKNLEKEDKQE